MEYYVILSRRKPGFSSKSHENRQFFSDKIVLPWQQHLSRYFENRSTYLNKIFTDLYHLSKAAFYQRINKIQNFHSFHVIMDQCLMVTVSFS